MAASAKNGDNNLAVQARLQNQIDFLASQKTLTDDERRIIDQKIIALTSSLKPEQLTDSQRSIAATARENEIARRETAERAANDLRTKQLEQQTALAKDMKRLADLAEKEGIAGTIRIINEAQDRAEVKLGNTPGNAAAKKLMER